MTRQDHLMLRVMEECAEVAQRVSKASAFGLGEVQPGQDRDNTRRVMDEFHDLVAVMEMAGFDPRTLDEEMIAAKKAKVERYLAYSRQVGRLEDDK